MFNKAQIIKRRLTPFLEETEKMLWEKDANEPNTNYLFTDDELRGATKLFMTVLLDKMFAKQLSEGLILHDAIEEAEQTGIELRELILKHTGIDTWELYKKYKI